MKSMTPNLTSQPAIQLIVLRTLIVLIATLAIRLLLADDFSLHDHGWGLLGSAAICFSIGCVCKVSWVLAQLNRRRQAAEQQLEHLVLH